MVQTVVKTEYVGETLKFENSLSESIYEFEVHGLTPERSYEDRDVYFRFSESGWLRGEDAIALGQLLVKHGTNALMANMIQHQHIHHISNVTRWLKEGRIEKVHMKMVDENPVNYGRGFRTYLVIPLWKNGMAPKYQEDFSFETVIYWSPLEEDYKKQLESCC